MKKQYSLDELYQKAASYCSISEHCRSDVEIKLKKWDVEDAVRSEIINKLIKNDFINERRFAKSFTRDKFQFNKWGKIKIAIALREKLIDRDIITNALNNIDEGEYEEMLASILNNKKNTISYNFEYERQGKLFRYAQSCGYENQLIERVIRNI